MNRRQFTKAAGLLGSGISLSGAAAPTLFTTPFAPSDKLIVGIMGVNSRGNALAKAFARTPNVEVGYICDVDARAMNKCIDGLSNTQQKKPKGVADLRRMLEDATVDAIAIAAPDHWHTTAAILALQAGKHVYVEKPASHNARELQYLVEAQKKHDKLVQLGTQRRSAPRFIEAIAKVHDGAIGKPYYGKAWYANTRGSIGKGKEIAQPAWLDYDMWQGPAPRRPYRDNLIHYNWHWFKDYGTGEACNNATHHVDLLRWALRVDFPTQVASNGGRYHYDDDWEFFDTQTMSFDFEGGASISWEGRSCNGLPVNGIGVGATVHGTEGSLLLDDKGCVFYDLKGKEVERFAVDANDNALNLTGAGDMTDLHIANFCDSIRGNATLNQPITEGYKSPLLCHLGNIAQFTGSTLKCNPQTGEIMDNPAAMKMWSRSYEPGWEPRV